MIVDCTINNTSMYSRITRSKWSIDAIGNAISVQVECKLCSNCLQTVYILCANWVQTNCKLCAKPCAKLGEKLVAQLCEKYVQTVCKMAKIRLKVVFVLLIKWLLQTDRHDQM